MYVAKVRAVGWELTLNEKSSPKSVVLSCGTGLPAESQTNRVRSSVPRQRPPELPSYEVSMRKATERGVPSSASPTPGERTGCVPLPPPARIWLNTALSPLRRAVLSLPKKARVVPPAEAISCSVQQTRRLGSVVVSQVPPVAHRLGSMVVQSTEPAVVAAKPTTNVLIGLARPFSWEATTSDFL